MERRHAHCSRWSFAVRRPKDQKGRSHLVVSPSFRAIRASKWVADSLCDQKKEAGAWDEISTGIGDIAGHFGADVLCETNQVSEL
jgi:hypothetical protein